ncbi:hypothetical protein [Methylobacterium sp. J-070]|uniref:hypothetical protein n=1 Tax=Methylobacterium sp. J-070 TaxID=2836650 RepID=UPI001FBA6564|nr:hypothetical protein [Methylobacterium sp. J-070]MCJ2050868.1 hypothetical protein [Methylobacterium sp. J-070]
MKRLRNPRAGGPTAYWAAMRGLTAGAGRFTMRDVFARCGAQSLNTVKCYVRACVRAGHVREVGAQPRPGSRQTPAKLYAVTATAPTPAPFEKARAARRFGAAQLQMWTAIRALPAFTSRELAAHASTDEVAVGPDLARIFCWHLRRAGYLQELGRSGRWRVLRLKPGMNTGPLPPAISGGGMVDRNPRPRRSGARTPS